MSCSAIPSGFILRKRKILADLSVPDAQYTDLSPKGSVDEGIRDLIRDVNALEGLVTTSSCAGRVSVFVEGSKKRRKKTKPSTQDDSSQVNDNTFSAEGNDNKNSHGSDFTEQEEDGERKFAASGGKGDGHWLYVSHDPVILDQTGKASFHDLFGLLPGNGNPGIQKADGSDNGIRLVRFHFEPMILHIMTATLKHAQPVLSAASSAGFRESGLQSLRGLDIVNDNPDQQQSTTLSETAATNFIVAVRSSGLSLESIIGYCEGEEAHGDENPTIRSLVTEEYLQILVALANERFEINIERVERFRTKLLGLCSNKPLSSSAQRGKKSSGWEDADARRKRKRAEGLQKKQEAEQQKKIDSLDNERSASTLDVEDVQMVIDS